MSRKIIQRIAITALIVVSALSFFASESGAEYGFDVPRMLGMEGIGESEVARIDGPPSIKVSGPIFEIHGKAVSFDKDLRDLPQAGPKDKKPAREMGTPPNLGPNGDGVDTVVQTSALLAPAPSPSSSFKGLFGAQSSALVIRFHIALIAAQKVPGHPSQRFPKLPVLRFVRDPHIHAPVGIHA